MAPENNPLPFDQLLGFLPQLEQLSAADIYVDPDRSPAPSNDDQGRPVVRIIYEYNPVIESFFAALSQECWMDPSYDPGAAGRLGARLDRVAQADLDELKPVLTWMVRGERFCWGHWGGVVDSGLAVAVLRRLQELRPESS